MAKEKEYQVFKDFSEFWYYTKELSDNQRDIIFNSLPVKHQKAIQRAYHVGGWEDLFIRNEIDERIDKIKKEMKFDVIYMRCHVVMGKSYYIKKSLWQYINDLFCDFPDKHKQYIFGGIKYQEVNEQTILVLKEDSKEE